VRLLLDTQVFVWSRLTPKRIRPDLRRRILNADQVFVSIVSAVEIAIKVSIGKLDVPADVEEQIHAAGYDPLPVTFRHAELLRTLPLHHRDPFDRLLIAQAQAERLTVVTADSQFTVYGLPIIEA
jgi:PIN domain nuclease of toxin-antitoxin system